MAKMYISDRTLSASFARLQSANTEGKRGMERTSALMYFLAHDAMIARGDTSQSTIVDMNPESPRGLLHRNQFVAQYMNLVIISTTPLHQIAELGKVTTGGRPPEKRASANFLTTPLKRASQSFSPMDYPSRPAPLLLLGCSEGGARWGVQRHPNWGKSIPSFLAETRSKTPFTDLAIVVLRKSTFGSVSGIAHKQLQALLETQYSRDLVDLWAKYMRFESKKPDCPIITLQRKQSTVLGDFAIKTANVTAEVHGTGQAAYIMYLERLLTENGISFNKGEL